MKRTLRSLLALVVTTTYVAEAFAQPSGAPPAVSSSGPSAAAAPGQPVPNRPTALVPPPAVGAPTGPAGASTAFPLETSDSSAPPSAANGPANPPADGAAPAASSAATSGGVAAPELAAAATPAATATPPNVAPAKSSSFGQPWDAASLAVDRHLEMPAEYVARALTQPEGTLSLSFANYTAFIATNQAVGWVPVFAFGITSDVEVALSAPLRYDEGLGDWTYLDPIADVTFKVTEVDDWEVGVRVGALVPVTSDAGAAVRLGVPLLLRVADSLRVDAAAELMWTFGKPTSAGIRVPISATWQAAPWFFTGLGAAPNLGVGGRSKTALDPFALFGLTLGARERAQMDVTARVFVENLGAGDRDEFADGAGIVITAGFFPDLY